MFPYNGDMNYGELHFYGENGTSIGYYEPLGDPLWEYVEIVLKKEFPEDFDSGDYNLGIRLQNVIAQCADKIENQKLTADILCPQCCSKDIALFHDEFVECRKVPRVSFKGFENYKTETKNNIILSHYKDNEDKYPPLRDGRSTIAKLVDFIGYIVFIPIRWAYNFCGKNV